MISANQANFWRRGSHTEILAIPGMQVADKELSLSAIVTPSRFLPSTTAVERWTWSVHLQLQVSFPWDHMCYVFYFYYSRELNNLSLNFFLRGLWMDHWTTLYHFSGVIPLIYGRRHLFRSVLPNIRTLNFLNSVYFICVLSGYSKSIQVKGYDHCYCFSRVLSPGNAFGTCSELINLARTWLALRFALDIS